MLFLLLKWKRSKDTFESQRILLKKIKAAISARASKFLGYRQQVRMMKFNLCFLCLIPFQQDAHELLSQCLDQLQDDLGHLGKSNGDSTDVRKLCVHKKNFFLAKVISYSVQFHDLLLQIALAGGALIAGCQKL